MMIASVMGIFGLLIWLAFLLVPIALLIVLQVWLCKKSLKLGLILPALSLCLSLLLVFSLASFTSFSGGGSLVLEGGTNAGLESGQDRETVQRWESRGGTVTVYDGEGNIIDQYPDPNYDPDRARADAVQTVVTLVVMLLVSNIPTVVFGGIWLHYKGRRDTQDDLKRMRVEDLG